MSKIKKNEAFNTILNSNTFLHFADNSRMGVTIIRRGYLKYFNQKFLHIFGYSREDIDTWKKFEYFKIIHPEDTSQLAQMIELEGKNNALLRFRGVRKNKDIIPIENYIYRIRYNNKYAYFSTYVDLRPSIDEWGFPKLIKTKEEKILLLKYHPDTAKFLETHNIDFEIIEHHSYREEK